MKSLLLVAGFLLVSPAVGAMNAQEVCSLVEERHAMGMLDYDAERNSFSIPFDRWRRLDETTQIALILALSGCIDNVWGTLHIQLQP